MRSMRVPDAKHGRLASVHVHTGMNVNQPVSILVIRFQSPVGFLSRDLIRDYFTHGMIRCLPGAEAYSKDFLVNFDLSISSTQKHTLTGCLYT